MFSASIKVNSFNFYYTDLDQHFKIRLDTDLFIHECNLVSLSENV